MLDFCPKCGKSGLEFHQNKLWLCSQCSFQMYFNVAAATAGILFYKGKLAVLKRKRDPGYGLLDLPGGFADSGESAEDAMRRECLEELGVEVESLQYLTSFPNRYPFKEMKYATCDLFFLGELINEPRLSDPEENSHLLLIEPDKIVLDEFAFPSIRQGLDYYFRKGR